VLKEQCLKADNRCFKNVFGDKWPTHGGEKK